MAMIVKSKIPLAILSILTVFLVLSWFSTDRTIVGGASTIKGWLGPLLNVTFIYGVVVLIRRHATLVARREGTVWLYSVVTIAFFLIMLVLGFGFGTDRNPAWFWFTDVFFAFPSLVILSMQAFTIISASYRCLRVRNVESSILLIALILVVIGSTSLGEAIWPASPAISTWIMVIPNAAGNRAITITAALGSIALAIRAILGYERRFAGVGQ